MDIRLRRSPADERYARDKYLKNPLLPQYYPIL